MVSNSWLPLPLYADHVSSAQKQLQSLEFKDTTSVNLEMDGKVSVSDKYCWQDEESAWLK